MRSITTVLVASLALSALTTAPLASGSAEGQTPAATGAPQAPEASAPLMLAPDYQIGPGDQIVISVSGLREFSQTARVSNSGRIHVPFVGVTMAAGMTTLELEREIATQIAAHELVRAPEVRVHIQQFSARPTYVVGDVRSPGQFIITGEMYLLDLLTRAGGALPSAADTALLYRRNVGQPVVQTRLLDPANPVAATAPSASNGNAPASSSRDEVIRVNLEEIAEGTRPELNLKLQGGDVLFVPRRQQQNIFVIGSVVLPGMYTLPRRGTVTAAQAIIYAGGPTDTAGTGSAFVMRHGPDGPLELPVDFKAILEGKTADLPIQGNDIIFVPNSAIKTFGVGVLNLGPRMLQQFLIF